MRLLVTILLLISLSAQAQDARQLFWSATTTLGGVDTSYVLDIVSGSIGAYSVRKMRVGYNNNCMLIRRSSDNAEQAIGFTASGEFDVSAFSTFIGAGQGFVVWWYDQSGNNRTAKQTTASLQPELKLNIKNGKPAIYFDGVDDVLTISNDGIGDDGRDFWNNLHSTTGTVTSVWQPGTVSNPNALYALIGNNQGATAQRGYAYFYDDRSSVSRNNGMIVVISRAVTNSAVVADVINNVMTANTFTLINSLVDAANGTANQRHIPYFNNAVSSSANTVTNAVSTDNATSPMQIGANGSSANFLNGYISELIIHNSKLSSTPLSTLNGNINAYYAIY